MQWKGKNRGIWEEIGGLRPSVERAEKSSQRQQEPLQFVCEAGGWHANKTSCTVHSLLSRDSDAETYLHNPGPPPGRTMSLVQCLAETCRFSLCVHCVFYGTHAHTKWMSPCQRELHPPGWLWSRRLPGLTHRCMKTFSFKGRAEGGNVKFVLQFSRLQDCPTELSVMIEMF